MGVGGAMGISYTWETGELGSVGWGMPIGVNWGVALTEWQLWREIKLLAGDCQKVWRDWGLLRPRVIRIRECLEELERRQGVYEGSVQEGGEGECEEG